MNDFWIIHGGARYQKFYMGMIFCDGRYYDKDENNDWYSVGIDDDGYPKFWEKVIESKTNRRDHEKSDRASTLNRGHGHRG